MEKSGSRKTMSSRSPEANNFYKSLFPAKVQQNERKGYFSLPLCLFPISILWESYENPMRNSSMLPREFTRTRTHSDAGTLFASFFQYSFASASLYLSRFSRENLVVVVLAVVVVVGEKKLKSREGKSLAGFMPESFFFPLPRSSLLPQGRRRRSSLEGGMIYIKEMLFGNKQSDARVGGS